MLKSVVWFITWNCQNHCPYCWQRQRQARGEFVPEPFIDWQKWAEAWNKIAQKNGIGFVMDISGGEPFIQPGFIDLLAALDDDIHLAITTNVKADMTEFVQKVSPAKVFSMTLSFHPTEMDFMRFFGKVLLLKNRGFKITVNFVTWPEQMYLIPEIKSVLDKYDIRLHIDPYCPTPYRPYDLTNEEKSFLKRFIDTDRVIAPSGVRPVMCSGGQEHLVVVPNGDAFRCVNDSIKGARIGNILDADGFELNREKTPCADYNVCAGCDRDKVKVDDV